MSTQSFADLGVSRAVRRALSRCGITAPFPVQRLVLEDVLAGRDVRLVKRLDAQGLHAVAIHGNKSQGQRDRALARFQSGHVGTLVATDVAARGIDVDGVSHVINLDPPADHHTYVHRVGRTGRAGNRGVRVTLVGAGERHEMRQLARRLGLSDGLGGDEHRARQAARAHSPRRRRPRTASR